MIDEGPTTLERRLWLAAGGLLVLIWASAYFVRFAVDAMRARNLLRVSVAILFVVVLVALTNWVASTRPRRGEVLLLIAAAATCAAAFSVMRRAEEALHLLEYSLIGLLIWGALRERRRRRPGRFFFQRAAPLAIVLTALAGWSDELVQGLLPNRYYDLRDVAFNALAGTVAVSVAALREGLREPRSEG